MRNFLRFIHRFFNLILFLVLQTVCIVLIARTRTMVQGNDLLNSANAVSGYMYDRQHAVVNYFGLRKMNDSLLQENERLRAQLAVYSATDTLETERVTRLVSLSDSVKPVVYASYTYHRARVIHNSVSATDNYITLNRGSADGIARDMAVVSGTGVVGRITGVSTHFSVVLSMLNVKQPVSARLKDGTYGFAYWEKGARPDELFMNDIPQEIEVGPGDTVFTTSYSTIYPRDLVIGVVTRVQRRTTDNAQFLHIKPATNFRNLQYVYVVDDEYVQERRKLEAAEKKKQ